MKKKGERRNGAARVRDRSIFSHENACRINFNAARRFVKKSYAAIYTAL